MSGTRQKTGSKQLLLPLGTEGRGEAPDIVPEEAEPLAAKPILENPALTGQLMEEVCNRENLEKAWKRVRGNKGGPGVDGMTINAAKDFLRERWPSIRSQLLEGSYQPHPVKRVEIPKPDGGVRKLGVPCVVDRLIQQAMLQVLQEQWDPTFSESSFGFRPERSAHQAVAQAQSYVAEGYGVVVDLDLEKFFDRVNHDSLMARVAARVSDKRVLKLIRAFLNAGVMEDGLVHPADEGTPQGGPLSPLLSNLVLDDLDKELTRRGHRFCRYADDCNIYVRSRRAGERVMASVSRYLTNKLRLKVNEAKSAVAQPEERKFLGFSISNDGSKRRIAPQALAKFKTRIRDLTRRTRGVSVQKLIKELRPYLVGWRSYFGFCQTPRVLTDLEAWIRRRLRMYIWRQWKNGQNRFKELRRLGVPKFQAAPAAGSSKGYWRMSHHPVVQLALRNQYFDSLGLPRIYVAVEAQFDRTAVVRTRMPGGVGGAAL
jgi:RNA-directed DNA polymerase